MISIVVSTYKKHLFEQLSKNIAETIGAEYELIPIHNPAQYSICEAYNMGQAKAKYPFICFLHEDIIIKTIDWGKYLVSLLEKDSSIGLIGVVGTKFRSSYPSALAQSPKLRQFIRGHVFQWIKNEGPDYVHLEFDKNEEKKELEEVVCVDGVFLFSRKEVFDTCRFDDKMLKYFHGYDIDFSLQVFFAGFKVLVNRNLLIYHSSVGNYDKRNTIANRAIAKKWWKKLPVATKDMGLSKIKLCWLNFLNWEYFIMANFRRKIFKH